MAADAMSFEVWVLDGRRLGTIGRGVGWWIGDWLRFGNARYGEKYLRASKITGLDSQTLMNMVYVSSCIEPSRRREKLSWSHHAEVAALAPAEQEIWFDRVEESRLSVHDLRLLLRAARKLEQAESPAADGAAEATDETVCPECGHAFHLAERRRRSGRRQRSLDVA